MYFLKTKDQVLGKFKEWHAMVENESRRKLKMVRSNRGGEFTSGEYNSYYKSHEIKRQKPTPHTPKENTVAECKMHIIIEMARSMIKVKDLLKGFWAEACNTAVYILNHRYTKVVNEMTPLQAYFGKKTFSYTF